MSQENESYLRFSLEESVWFHKGQEVAELYSISLDPNVTIQESDQYVFIRGSLDLSGEYKDSQNGDYEEFPQSFLPKAVQKVERHPDGLNEFTHRFPVDITIPNNRISSLEEIDITIQSFDYALPEHNCLKLQADLLITGIYNDSYVEERMEVDQETEETEFLEESDDENESYVPYAAAEPPVPDFHHVFRNDEQSDLYTPFSAEAKRVAEAKEDEEEEPVYLSNHQHNAPVFEIPVSPFPEEMQWEPEVNRQDNDIETQVKRRVIEIEEEKNETPVSKEKWPASFETEKGGRIEEQVKRRVDEIEGGKGESIEEQVKRRVDEIEAKKDAENKGNIEEQVKRRVAEIEDKKGKRIETEVKRKVAEIEEEKEGSVYLTDVENVPVVKIPGSPHQEQDVIVNRQDDNLSDENESSSLEKDPESLSSLTDLFKRREKPEKQAKEMKNYKGRKKQNAEQGEKENQDNADKQHTIMDLFGRKQEEELVRMKVCIVQQGETIDDLAQRYGVTVQSLLLSNELEGNQSVTEGQVIYIPKSIAYKN
ncbi:LysM peptidoglycan-binding domain-containing protein [Peribacillus sp.]|uniref:LysM peptidoglycan-binding domain-containing protein n=1 Tax=Peribacillus sp. TaxID=2675267 RepID=UPI00388F0FC6